jgi:hypothetical protein
MSTWTHSEAFPLIGYMLRDKREYPVMSSWEIAEALANDSEAQLLIDAALRKRGRTIPRGRSRLAGESRFTMRFYLAIEMVAWWNARWNESGDSIALDEVEKARSRFTRIGSPGSYGFKPKRNMNRRKHEHNKGVSKRAG